MKYSLGWRALLPGASWLGIAAQRAGNDSVDLITVAQALLWFDLLKFLPRR
jgi:hypothetical protein